MLEWLIVGGGIHGTNLANMLVTQEGIPLDRVMIVDPMDAPCQRWKELTSRTGMKYLRSPIVHHVDVDPTSLIHFMGRPGIRKWASALGVTQRPSLRVFNAHIDHVVDKSGIYKAYKRAAVYDVQDKGTHLVVETTLGSVKTKNMVLAISSNQEPRMQDWMHTLADDGAVIRNVFEEGFTLKSISPGFTYAVVGSGLTAVQLALAVSSKAPGKTVLITKGEIEINDLDFNPCWVGPKCLDPFSQIDDYGRRRNVINLARNTGSIPRFIAGTLKRAKDKGQILHLESRANAGHVNPDQKTTLELKDGRSLTVDRVLVAIGFEKRAPGSEWLLSVRDNLGLPVHMDGYPITDDCLRWHDRIFVSGALAELEIGAASRNVIGARLAGSRISKYLQDVEPYKQSA